MTATPRPPRAATETWGQTPAPSPRAPLGPRAAAPPDVEQGRLVVFRQFDIADEIDLAHVQRLQSASRTERPWARTTALMLSTPPVAISLGTRTIELGGHRLDAELTARVFDFGATSIRLRFVLPSPTRWTDVSALVRAAQTDETLTRIAREEVVRLAEHLKPAITNTRDPGLFEDYAVVYVERFAGGVGADALPPEACARLVLGERDDARLSETELEEALTGSSSYYGDDLCLVGWNTALVVDPSGGVDILELLEFANAQLLELRFYDELLDDRLSHIYDEVGSRRRRPFAIFSNYGPVQREAMALILEIAEFIERVENALKITGDVYLARVYANAVDALRIPSWERSVSRKQELLRQVYEVLKSEVDSARGQLLEFTIVLLIVLEIFLAFGQ